MWYFRTLKAAFYAGVMLAGMWLVLDADVGPTTASVVFTGFALFLIVYVTEVKEIELASTLASGTVTFFASNETEKPEDDD